MSAHARYTPGPANIARIEKEGEKWTLVLLKELRHPPEKVWRALTEPEHLREWAPFDADGSLGTAGATVKLATANMPALAPSETIVTRADAPKLLEYTWGGSPMRWQLEPIASGTRLTLWTSIDRRFIAMGAAGWHVCLDVLEHHLAGDPMGRLVAGDALQSEGWQRLHREYAAQFSVDTT